MPQVIEQFVETIVQFDVKQRHNINGSESGNIRGFASKDTKKSDFKGVGKLLYKIYVGRNETSIFFGWYFIEDDNNLISHNQTF